MLHVPCLCMSCAAVELEIEFNLILSWMRFIFCYILVACLAAVALHLNVIVFCTPSRLAYDDHWYKQFVEVLIDKRKNCGQFN